MNLGQIVSTLQRHAADLRRLGVAKLFLFGSVARGEAIPESDVDLFFDYADRHFSLFELVALQDRLSDLLQTRADIASRGSLHPRLRQSIERSAIQVF